MTYNEMYDVLSFLKEKNITLKPKYIKKLTNLDYASRELYEVLELEKEYIDIFFSENMDYGVAEFLVLSSHKKIEIEKVEQYLTIANNQPNEKMKKIILKAITDTIEKGNSDILSNALTQDSVEKINFILTLYCEQYDSITKSKYLMYHIKRQSSVEDMIVMRDAFFELQIIKNPFFVQILSDAKGKEKEILLNAFSDEKIRSNPFLLYMIAKQEGLNRKIIMLQACSHAVIRKHPEKILFLDSISSYENMQYYYELLEANIGKDRLLLETTIANYKPSIQKDLLCCLGYIIYEISNQEDNWLYQVANQSNPDAMYALVEAYKDLSKVDSDALIKTGVDDETILYLLEKKQKEIAKKQTEENLQTALEQALLEGNSTDFCGVYEASDKQVLERVMHHDIRLSSEEEK